MAQVVTARTVSIAQTTVTIRSPMTVWVLGFFTLGIYTAFWTYWSTRELLFVLAFFHSWYLQRSLNRAWERAERGR